MEEGAVHMVEEALDPEVAGTDNPTVERHNTAEAVADTVASVGGVASFS